MNGIPIWRIVLGLYLVIVGGVAVLSLSFEGLQVVLGIAALIAGFALWWGK